MLVLDLALEGVLMVLSSVSLFFVLKAKRTLQTKTLNRGILFLSLDTALEFIEDLVGIRLGFRSEADSLVLEILVFALIITSLYYAIRARRERATEFLGMSGLCMVWVVLACTLEITLGLILRRGG